MSAACWTSRSGTDRQLDVRWQKERRALKARVRSENLMATNCLWQANRNLTRAGASCAWPAVMRWQQRSMTASMRGRSRRKKP
jgi:hypothetical protein